MPEQNLEQIPKDIIRVETALSRFPIHRLSKKGNVSIEIKKTNPNGELRTRWEVTYNSKFGQPGPLAYKLDTLIINRRIEEAGKPEPKVIRLGLGASRRGSRARSRRRPCRASRPSRRRAPARS